MRKGTVHLVGRTRNESTKSHHVVTSVRQKRPEDFMHRHRFAKVTDPHTRLRRCRGSDR